MIVRFDIFRPSFTSPTSCVRSRNYTFDGHSPTETPSATNACDVRICDGKKSEETRPDDGFASEHERCRCPGRVTGRCSSGKIVPPDILTGGGRGGKRGG